jgi:hypothetical protein
LSAGALWLGDRRLGQRLGLAARGSCRDQFGRAGLGGITAEIGEDAIRAFRLAGLADIRAVQDQPVMRIALVPGGCDCLQRLLNLERVLARRKTGPVRDPKDMCVDRDRRLRRAFR